MEEWPFYLAVPAEFRNVDSLIIEQHLFSDCLLHSRFDLKAIRFCLIPHFVVFICRMKRLHNIVQNADLQTCENNSTEVQERPVSPEGLAAKGIEQRHLFLLAVSECGAQCH